LVDEKIAAVPIKSVLIGEPTGGWGRQINGADKLAQSLDNKGHSSLSSQLKAHLEIVRVARTLQPQLLPHRSDEEIKLGIERMHSAGVELPAETNLALTRRRAKLLQAQVLESQAVTPQLVETFLQVVNPWSMSAEPASSDPLLQCLWHAPEVGEADKVKFFESNVIQKVAVPWLIAGDTVKLVTLAAGFEKVVSTANILEIGTSEAAMLSEIKEAKRVIDALLVPIGMSRPFHETMKKVRTMFGRTGSSVLQRISTAIGQHTSFKQHFSNCLLAGDVLDTIMPEVEGLEKRLAAIGTLPDLDSQLAVFADAAALLLRHGEVAPEGSGLLDRAIG